MCVVTPIYISFNIDGETEDYYKWQTINLILDAVFGIDICVVFLSSYYDENFKLIDDRKEIAHNYIRGMFFLDIIALFPFEILLKN